MFNKKTVDLYKSITAPDSLRQRILTTLAEKESKKAFFIPKKQIAAFASLAACICIICAFSFLHTRRESLVLSIDGTPIADSAVFYAQSTPAVFSARTVPINAEQSVYESVFPVFDLETAKETKISVTLGVLLSGTGKQGKTLTLNKGKHTLTWCAENLAPDDAAQLTVTCGKQTQTYTLSKENTENVWVLRSKE